MKFSIHVWAATIVHSLSLSFILISRLPLRFSYFVIYVHINAPDFLYHTMLNSISLLQNCEQWIKKCVFNGYPSKKINGNEKSVTFFMCHLHAYSPLKMKSNITKMLKNGDEMFPITVYEYECVHVCWYFLLTSNELAARIHISYGICYFCSHFWLNFLLFAF